MKFWRANGYITEVELEANWEWKEWEQHYLPPSTVSKQDLILDVGARDGDTAWFYIKHGYTNLFLVEPNTEYHEWLLSNVAEMRKGGATIWVYLEPFELRHLQNVAFLKMDCEGCEYEYDYKSFGIPYVVELHVKTSPDEHGVYPYVQFLRYDKSVA